MSRNPKLLPRDEVRVALKTAHGIQDRAARVFGIPRTTLQRWLSGPYGDMRSSIEKLRAQHAPDGRGRPWTTDGERTRAAVARAWKASGYRLTAASRLLDLPRSSLRHLLHRYRLPNLPASGRKPQK